MAGTFTANPSAGTTTVSTTAAPSRPSDDEILGIVTPRVMRRSAAVPDATGFAEDASDGYGAADGRGGDRGGSDGNSEDAAATDRDVRVPLDTLVDASPELKKIVEEHPEFRAALSEASAYREVFETPEAAKSANAVVADVNRLDALFFSRKPEDHVELARAVEALDRDAFVMLAKSMGELAAQRATEGNRPDAARRAESRTASIETARSQAAESSVGQGQGGAVNSGQREFIQATNAAAVESVVREIEAQVGKLLPEGIAKTARNRVVGEIYRELDAVLQGNRALTQQVQEAFRTGRMDTEHQKALVGLISARAKQALPAVAKRVMNEWTNTIVTVNQERRTRQRNAERRVDIAGTGGGASGQRRGMTARDIDYRRMSDADILNL